MKKSIIILVTALLLAACSPASSDENGIDTEKMTPVSTTQALATAKFLTEDIDGVTVESSMEGSLSRSMPPVPVFYVYYF